MGLFRQLLKVIRWNDDRHDLIVYRHPMEDRDEIMNGCQLIVAESQVAILVSKGQIADVYGPGEHKLTTGNMPILTKLASWKYGFDSPFKADVYYVNTKQFTNMKWGTSTKITMRDAEFGMVRLGGRGTYSFRVADAAQFMREIFGTNKSYETSSLVDYFRSIVIANFTKVIGEARIPAIDLPAKYIELGENVQAEIKDDFEKLGLEICAFYVESINLPEEVEKAIDKRAATGVMGDQVDTYTRLQAAEAMRDAAKNPGGGFASAGVGLAAGMAMGNNMAQAMNGTNNQQQAQQTNNFGRPGSTCPKCGKPVPAGSKFCPECGSPIAQKKFCTNCGHELSADAKFCPECGTKA